MENINFKGIPTSLFLNGPNLEIVSDPQNVTDVVGLATFTGIATATFINSLYELDGGSIDFKWYYNGSRILDVSEDITSGAGISTFDYVTGTGSTITISGENSDLNGKEVYFTADYIPSAYQSETPVTAGTARSTGNAFNEPLQSGIATIGVKPEIEITNQPNPVYAPLNATATYNIEARTIPGNGPVSSYQWQLDGNNLVDGDTTTQVQDVDNLIGIITIDNNSLGIGTTINLNEVSSYDQFNPGQQYTLTPDRDVIVRFRLDGAAGGASYLWPDQGGGRGGLSEGTITLLNGQGYILNVGERGEDYSLYNFTPPTTFPGAAGAGGWPGGGSGVLGWGGGGGGYTGLFLSTVSYETSLLIAGGGGGSSSGSVGSIGGNGGGLTGGDGAFWGNEGQMGQGGTQNPPITPATGNGPGNALWPRTSPSFLGTPTFNGANGGGGGGGGYWGGGGGAVRDLSMSSAGGGGSGHINVGIVTDGTTTLGEGSIGDGYARMDFISTAKDVKITIVGATTNNLSITTNHPAAGVIRCSVSADNVQESPVFSRSVSYYTSNARNLVNIEEITTESGIIREVNLSNGEFVFEASSNDNEPPKLYSFYSPEKDLRVQMDLYGGMGENSQGPNPSIGGEGGLSTIEFTMEQNVEYVIAGLIPGVNAPFLYEKARLIAVVGAGGGGGRGGDGGLGGGCGISGGIGSGSGDGGFGGATLQDQLTDNGIFGSSLQASELYDGDTQAQGSDGGRTIQCTKGVYWRDQNVGACVDVGNVQFRLPDGSIVVPSGTIERGYKAGYNIMQTGGWGVDVLDANGGAGVSGGWGASISRGGGGGAGYNDSSITVISAERGGSTFAQARVVLRVVSD